MHLAALTQLKHTVHPQMAMDAGHWITLTGPAFTRKGLEFIYLQRQGAFCQPEQLSAVRHISCSRPAYLDSAHSECTRNMARANEPTSMPSPGISMEQRSTHTLHADKRQQGLVMARFSSK